MRDFAFTRRQFLIATGAAAVATTMKASGTTLLWADELAAGFADPPWEARPSTYWLWLNGFTDNRRLTYELEELKKAGVNAAYILEIGARGADSPPAGPAYMGPDSLKAIGHAVREAGRLGLEVGITNASSWNSGGSWVGPEHASKGLYWSQVSVEGPIRFSEVLPFPKLPTRVPRKRDGTPAFYSEVAVLAVSEKEHCPGFDFLFDLAPGIHTIDRVALHNVAAESAVKEFVVFASAAGMEAADFHEAYRGVLEARTGPQSFRIPAVRARYLKLRVVSGHNAAGRVALAEFEAYAPDGKNVVTIQRSDGRRPTGGLLRFTAEAGLEREWKADNVYDGRLAGATGSWAADGPPPPLVKDPAEIIDLSSGLDPEGRLTWDVPSGRWTVYRFLAANNGEKLVLPSPHSDGYIIDHYSADATRMHTEYMLDRLRSELGDIRQTALKYFYACSYEVRGSIWTPTLLEEFRRRRGYDMRRFLPVFAGAVVESDEVTDRFRIDYRRTIAELFAGNFYRTTRETAAPFGLKLVAEAGGPGWPIHQVPVDALKAQGSLSIPRGEFWKVHSIWVVKETASAAHVYGQRLVQMEAFTSFRFWEDGPRDLKDIADHAFCDGANHFVWHTMSHCPEQGGKPGWEYHAGTHFGPNETWWPMVRPFLDYLARCSWLLRQGLFVGDICYYYGERGFNFAPEKSAAPELGLPAGYDFDTTNTDVIMTRMEVKDGKLVLPDGMSYEMLVLPDRADMDPEVLEKIEQLVQQGATISGPKPKRATSLNGYPACDSKAREVADRLWGNCDGAQVFERSYGKGKVFWGVPVADILGIQGVPPDFSFSSRGTPVDLDYIHRLDADRDIYFVSNKLDSWAEADCVFRTKGQAAELCDPVTGATRILPVSGREDGRSRITLALAPLGSAFVVFSPSPQPVVGSITLEGKSIAGNAALEQLASVEVAMPAPDRLRLLSFAAGAYRVRVGDRERECVVTTVPAAIEIDGSWDVRFAEGWGAPASKTFPRLMSWTEDTEPGVKYFSGIARYVKTFDLPQELLMRDLRLFLDLGEVQKIARITLNGAEVGICWTRPFQLEITAAARPGANRLEVEVANTWANRILGDLLTTDGTKFTHTNIRLDKKTPLMPSGLLGPVRIVPARQSEVRLT
jgi:(4-O-methyl)-D-glucuronate---lignin esterase